MRRTFLALLALACLSGCASDEIVVPPPPTETDYQCATEGDLQCVRKLQPDVQDCIIDQVARQLAACTKRCEANAGNAGEQDCGASCNREKKSFLGSAVATCRPPARTIPPP